MVGADFATPVAAPDCAVLSVEPAKPMVKRGAWAALRVIFENRSDAPCSLVFRFRPSFFLGFMGEPVPRTTGGFGVETRSFLGDSSLDDPPGPVALGALLGENRELIEVELEPHGRAVATVNWQAVGFLPGKRYRPRRDASGLEEWVPQPLPRGTYRLVIRTPLVGPGGDLVTTTVVAEVR
jgi:hypothetical protein